ATWSPTLPMGLGSRLGLDGGGAGAYTDRRAATLGALSFFLPCGFTQAIQVFALSTGSPLYSAALLGAFAIGTAPGLLALAGVPVAVPSKARPTLLRLVGVFVIGFALMNATSALRLSGITVTLPSIATAAAAVPAGVVGSDGSQTLNTIQEADGYSPSNVAIYAGIPTRWLIDSRSSASCATSLVVPRLGVSRRLQRGTNEIDLPALPAGALDYSCAMGMFGGRITIVPPPAASPSTAPAGG
ncbi:MAG TPA: sulfite exporter TauE/SafE family protein, partial [Candidatus Dormibacteraeota bacterium]|nr:sulfite exporter TauE/SafE family protein [Candidatus Dormibacteraeota bacterium]